MLLDQKEIAIREAVYKDIPQIVSIHKDCILKINSKVYSPKIIEKWVKTVDEKSVRTQFKSTKWLVCEAGERIIGFAQYSILAKIVFQIQIDPDFQRRGVGTLLYNFMEKKFIGFGVTGLSLNSTLNAVPFYRKLGFSEIGKIDFRLEDVCVEMVEMRKNFE